MRVLVGFAGVDDDRALELAREPDLRAEHRAAARPAARSRSGSRGRFRRPRAPPASRRAAPGRRRRPASGSSANWCAWCGCTPIENRTSGQSAADAFGLRGFLRVARLENHQRALDARVPRAGDHLVEIGGERLVGEMTVAVDHSEPGGEGLLAGGVRRSNAVERDAARSALRRVLVASSAKAYSSELRDHPLERPVVDALLFDGFTELQRQARPRDPGVVGDERDRHAVLQIHAERMAFALDAEDQIVAAERDLDQHRFDAISRSSPSAIVLVHDAAAVADAARVPASASDARMWKRSASGGTSPSTSSPAWSAIAHAADTARAGNRSSSCGARSRAPRSDRLPAAPG